MSLETTFLVYNKAFPDHKSITTKEPVKLVLSKYLLSYERATFSISPLARKPLSCTV